MVLQGTKRQNDAAEILAVQNTCGILRADAGHPVVQKQAIFLIIIRAASLNERLYFRAVPRRDLGELMLCSLVLLRHILPPALHAVRPWNRRKSQRVQRE